MSEESEAERNIQAASAPFFKIVLTGGPCAGKTTALARVSTYLRERGFECFTAPEAFTLISSNGFSLDYFSTDGMDLVCQTTVMDLQISCEDGMERLIRARGNPGVLLCDRGLMDNAVYMPPEKWQKLLDSRNCHVTECREGRYNAVYHLVTAAEGAEAFYTLENNEVRSETPEQARVVDLKTQKAWVGHPAMYVIDNSTDFEGKLQRLVDSIAMLVGLPTNLSRTTTKFLLRGRPSLDVFPADVDYHVFDVEKVYLVDSSLQVGGEKQFSEEYTFIRKRTNVAKDGTRSGSAYGLTTFQRTKNGQTIERKRIMSAREYMSSLKQRDLTRHIVRQQRISFLWKLQSFNIHIYEEPVLDICLLHAQIETLEGVEDCKVELPPFLDVVRSLQDTREDAEKYGAFSISLIDKSKSTHAHRRMSSFPLEPVTSLWKLHDELLPLHNEDASQHTSMIPQVSVGGRLDIVRNLKLIGYFPTSQWKNDPSMPSFCQQHKYRIGYYMVAQCDLLMKNNNDEFMSLVWVVNYGDGDCNTGYWGGVFTKQEPHMLVASIQSTGDTETTITQNHDLSIEYDEKDLAFPQFHESDDENERRAYFSGLAPGNCQTPLEKILGATLKVMMETRLWRTLPKALRQTGDPI